MDDASDQKVSFWDRVQSVFQKEPETREELLAVIREANSKALIDQESMDTIARVLQVSELRVRDVMIPRAQMVVVNKDDDPEKILPVLIESAHSRFPVIDDDDRDKVVGILLAKDLLRYFHDQDEEFKIKDVLRSAVFIPDSKRLNVLLAEFQENRNHMAVVVDEYGGVDGLVTIEDVIEQIVGDIEDEHDIDEEENMVLCHDESEFIIKARLPIEDFNERFGTQLSNQDYDTIGGLIIAQAGYMPKRGEHFSLESMDFEILNADSRRVHLLKLIKPLPEIENNA